MQSTSNQPGFNHLDENHSDHHSFTVALLESEIQEVQKRLIASTGDLPTPLGDLVRAQIRRSQPPLCGAVVLTVSIPPSTVMESSDIKRKRILLASALEMLHIALNVHRLLITAAAQGAYNVAPGEQQFGNAAALDRTFIGSTILAGDYCFSRAAQMAAQTDNPHVVATFSHALQSVSEGLLREQFSPLDEQGQFNEMGQLLQSGAQAAAQLSGLAAWQEQQAMTQSQELATSWRNYQQDNAYDIENAPHNWQILYQWLTLYPR